MIKRFIAKDYSNMVLSDLLITEADYNFWTKADLWSIARGALLILGIEEIPSCGGSNYRLQKLQLMEDYTKICSLARSSIEAGNLKVNNDGYYPESTNIRPSIFIAWARLKGFPIPSELESLEQDIAEIEPSTPLKAKSSKESSRKLPNMGQKKVLRLKSKNTLEESANWLTQETGEDWTPAHLLDAISRDRLVAFVITQKDMQFLNVCNTENSSSEFLVKKHSLYQLHQAWAYHLEIDGNSYTPDKNDTVYFDISINYVGYDVTVTDDMRIITGKTIGHFYESTGKNIIYGATKIMPTITFDDIRILNKSLQYFLKEIKSEDITQAEPKAETIQPANTTNGMPQQMEPAPASSMPNESDAKLGADYRRRMADMTERRKAEAVLKAEWWKPYIDEGQKLVSEGKTKSQAAEIVKKKHPEAKINAGTLRQKL